MGTSNYSDEFKRVARSGHAARNEDDDECPCL